MGSKAMKQSEAVDILRALMRLLQKVRSNAAYELGFQSSKTMTRVLPDVMPGVFDDKRNILTFVTGVLDKYEKTGVLSPMDFYNLMALAHHERALPSLLRMFYDVELPEPNPVWVMGWASE